MKPFAVIDSIVLVADDDGTVIAVGDDGPTRTGLTVTEVVDHNLYRLLNPTEEQAHAATLTLTRVAAVSPHLQERGLWNDPGSGRFVRRGWSSLKWLFSLQAREQRFWKKARDLDLQGSPVDVVLARPRGQFTPGTRMRVREVFDQGTGNKAGKLRVAAPDGRSFLIRWSDVADVTTGEPDQTVDLVQTESRPLDRVASLTAADFVSGDAFRAATAGLVHTPDDADVQVLKQPDIDIREGMDTLEADLLVQAEMLSRFPLVDVLVEAVNAAITPGGDDSTSSRSHLAALLTGPTRQSMSQTAKSHSSLTQLGRILVPVMDPYVGVSRQNTFIRNIMEYAATPDGAWLNDVFDFSEARGPRRSRLVRVDEDAPSGVSYDEAFVGQDGGIRWLDRANGVRLLVDADGEPLKVGDTVYYRGRVQATVTLSGDGTRVSLQGPMSEHVGELAQAVRSSPEDGAILWTRSPLEEGTVLLLPINGSQLSIGDRIGDVLDNDSLPVDAVVADVVSRRLNTGEIDLFVVAESPTTGDKIELPVRDGRLFQIPELEGSPEFDRWLATRPLEFSGADTTGRIPAAQQLAEALIRRWADAQDAVAADRSSSITIRFVPPMDRTALRGADLSGRDLSGVDLTGYDLTDAILVGADLRNATLRDAQLSGADLQKADLRDAKMERVVLTGANLSGARLSGANLTNARLTNANLTGARLVGAFLSDANLTEADLTEADLTEAVLTRANLNYALLTDANLYRASLTDANLTNAPLYRASLTGADLTGADLRRANLTGADLTDAFLTDADLAGVVTDEDTRFPAGFVLPDTPAEAPSSEPERFVPPKDRNALRGADLSGRDLSGVDLSGYDLSGANLTDANLTGARLHWANLTGADLTDANLTRANLTNARLTEAVLTRANLNYAFLTDANLYRASLTGADLTGADLRRANLTGADLTDANLTGADLTGAYLTGAVLTGANTLRLSANRQIATALMAAINGSWADSSQSTLSTGLQYAAAELTGNTPEDFREWQAFIRSHSAFGELTDSQLILTRPVALSTYLLTQQMLRDQGIGPDDMVLVWRGSGDDEWLVASDLSAPVRVRTNPLSATATSLAEASSFGSRRIGMRVPASHVFSTAHTGPGTYRESEVLVLGSPNVGFVGQAVPVNADSGVARAALADLKAATAIDAASWLSYPADTVRWFGAMFGDGQVPGSAAVRLASYLDGGLVGAHRDRLRFTHWYDEAFPALDDDAAWAEWAARVDVASIGEVATRTLTYGLRDLSHSRPWDSKSHVGDRDDDARVRMKIDPPVALAVASALLAKTTHDSPSHLSLAHVLFANNEHLGDEPPIIRQVLQAVPREQRPEMLDDMIAEMFQLGERLAPDALFDRLGEVEPSLLRVDRAMVRNAIGDMLATDLIQTVLPNLYDDSQNQLDWKYTDGKRTAPVPMYESPSVDGRRYVMRTNAPPDAEDPASMHWWETSWVEATATGDELIRNYQEQAATRARMHDLTAKVYSEGRVYEGRPVYADTPDPVVQWLLNLSWPQLLQMIRDPASFADEYAAAFGDTGWFRDWPFDRLLTELFDHGAWADLRTDYMLLGELQAEADKLLTRVRSSVNDELAAA